MKCFEASSKLSFYKRFDLFCKPTDIAEFGKWTRLQNKSLKEDSKYFLRFKFRVLQFQFEISIPYFEVSDRSYEVRRINVNRFDYNARNVC